MRIIVCLILILGAFCLNGQQKDGIMLVEYLEQLEKREGINFSYDPESLAIIQIDTSKIPSTFREKLAWLSAHRSLEIEKISETYYALSFRKKQFQIAMVDAENGENLNGLYATVQVNGAVLSSAVIAEGAFSFEYKPNPKDSISLTVLGYQPIQLTVEELVNNEKQIYRIKGTIVYLDQLVIKDYLSRGINIDPKNNKTTIQVTDLPSLPGETDGDIFASLAVLPGVTSPDNRPGNLFIRGSSTDQSLILFDDIPVYHRGHYFGSISPYNQKMVDHVNVYKSGMHPRYGGRVGGALELNSSSDLTVKPSYGLGVNTLYGLGYLKTPIFNKKVGLAIGARRSFPVTFNSPKLNAISDVVYAGTVVEEGRNGEYPYDFKIVYDDYNVKIEIPLKNQSKLSFSGLYAKNIMGYVVPDSIYIWQQNGFKNLGLNAKYELELNENIKATTSITWSNYLAEFKEERVEGQYSKNGIEDLRFSQQIEWKMKQWDLEAGADVNIQQVDFEYFDHFNTQNMMSIVNDQGLSNATTISAYANGVFNKFERLTVQLGARASYYTPLNDFALMPRFNANYDLSEKLLLKTSFGTYRQYLSQIKYLEFSSGGFDNALWGLAGDDLSIITGVQTMVGFLWVKNKLVVDVEAYHKVSGNVNYTKIQSFQEVNVFGTADHTTNGVDVFAKRKVANIIDFWLSYTLSQSTIDFNDFEKKKYISPYDQTHVFQLGTNYSGERLSIGASWKIASGLYAHSFDYMRAKSNFEKNAPPRAQRNNPFLNVAERNVPVHSLDISASYKLPKAEKRPFNSSLGISILNVYNQTNLVDRVIRSGDVPTVFSRYSMKFAPNVMLAIEF
jgi:hypothetical protein